MIHSKLLYNHEIRSSSELILSPGQVGLLNGWGVFSTIKVVDGVLFAFARHWARMRRDAEVMRVLFPWTPEELEESLLRLVEANQAWNSTLRVTICRNRGTMWAGPVPATEIDLFAFTAERSDWGRAVRLGVVPNARYAASRFAGTKVMSWAMNLIWYEEAHAAGLDEVILLNERGEVSELTSANLFAEFGSQMRTPPLKSSGCLPGITRELLLEQIRVEGVEVVESVLTLDDLAAADGLFISSSTRDLLPVESIEGLSINHGDEMRQRLLVGYRAYQSSYVASAARRARRPA
ncbi:MAG TPA: aminotransferase class IV [Bryobacteraceae bacterium]|nr:aminotransferase class IV [Bryobacteraceae bacterium]